MPMFYDDPASAGPMLRDFLSVIPDGEQDVRRYYAMALLAEVDALDGDVDSADELANEALQVARRQGLEEYPATEQVHLALGLAPLARSELDAAEERFERAVGLARRGGDKLEYAHALVWMARLRVLQDDPQGAGDALRAAREVVPDLGDTAMGSLVRALALRSDGNHPAVALAIGDGEALTDAELRVLRLLPGDLTYREMAQHLYVSLNTVRTHALRVRRKLGASTRAEAVSQARARGLL
jgi:LuxR family maltose regulon positive regulatory protein